MNANDELMMIVGTGYPAVDGIEGIETSVDTVIDTMIEEDKLEDPVDQGSKPFEPVIEPEVTEVIEDTSILPSNLGKSTEDEDFGIKKLVSKFGTTVDIIIQNQSKDRDQLEDAIGYFENEVKEARKSNQRVSPAMIEAWTKLLQTKTEVNTNASRVLDSVARLISAGKGNDLVINLNQAKSANELDLNAILAQPDYDDEGING